MEKNKLTRDRPSDLSAIQRWYSDKHDEVELTPHQEEKRERYLKISSLMVKGYINPKIIEVLKKDYGISEAQCYRDIRDSVALYGNIRKAEKEGMRYILFDMMNATREKALNKGDFRAAATAESNMMKLMGLDREDPEMPDFENLQPSLNITVVDPAAEKQMIQLLGKGPVDMDQLLKNNKQIIDVEHEDVTHSSGETE